MKTFLLQFLFYVSVIAGDPKVVGVAVVPNTRQVIAGSGLLGGGALTGDITLTLDPAAGAVPSTRTIAINGTANEITSSAGAQSLALDRSWTLSLPTALTFTGKTITGGTFSSPILTTPFLGSFVNAAHTHLNAAGGGNLDTAAITSGTWAAARMPALTGDVTSSAGAVATTIANNAVTTAKINNNAVDGTKIALGSDAQGDVMYYNGTDWVRLGAGTSGQFFKTLGAAANPAWASDVSPYVTLTDGATITWTAVATRRTQNATVTLGGNRTLAFSGTASGMDGILIVKQDGTGSRTLTLPAGSIVISGGTGAITLTTAASAVDVLTWTYDGTNYYWNYGKNYN